MKEMRDRMERFVILPFSVGCVSESSVAVAVQQQQQQQPRRSKQPAADTNSSTATRTLQEEDEESLASESMKLKFLPIQKPDISYGFHRLCKGFKTLSHQLFAYKDIEDIEESEEEMEIGLPTDVKHVTHIGLDGSTSRSSLSMGSSWENLFSPQDLFSFPSVPSSGQCEIPMETKPTAASPPLVQAST